VIRNFEQLKVWQEGKQGVLKTYLLTNIFPKGEVYGLTSQVRQGTLFVPADIGQSSSRFHFMEKLDFYSRRE